MRESPQQPTPWIVGYLQARDLSVRFGGVLAVDGVSFDVQRGEVFTLIGPNGAGKTTVFNLIRRIYTATAGTLRFDGQMLDAVPPHGVADACVQLHGGYGFMAEVPIARAYVDARAQRIHGGTNEIMKELISRQL